MNKTELTALIAEKTSLNKKQASEALDAAMEAIQDIVAAGEKVSLIGFGTFEKKDRPERMGRNPQTGEAVKIAASAVPAFKPGKAFKDKVKNYKPKKKRGKKKKAE